MSDYSPQYRVFLKMREQQTDDCILWPYSRSAAGYGRVSLFGRPILVARHSCELEYGSPEDDRCVSAHSCRNRHCFNPRHLRWATHAENTADMHKDGTSTRGSKQPNAKLTAQDVWQIRFFSRGGMLQETLAKHFGVSRPTISEVVNYRTWGWL